MTALTPAPRVLVAVMLVAACRSASPARPIELAPSDTEVAVFVHPRGLAAVEAALQRLRDAGHGRPALASVVEQVDGWLARQLGGPFPSNLAEAGLSVDGELAIFITPRGPVTIWPVVERSRFVAARQGTRRDGRDHFREWVCAPKHGRYVCAAGTEQLEQVAPRRVALAPAEDGDIQIVIAAPGSGRALAAFGVTFTRGQATLRGAFEGDRDAPIDLPLASAVPPDPTGLAAFTSVAVRRDDHRVTTAPFGLGPLLEASNGHLIIRVPHGTRSFDGELPIRDHTPFDERVARCELLALPELHGTPTGNGGCRLETVRGAPLADVRVDGDVLRIRGGTPGTAAPHVAGTLAHLLEADWSAAFWGRGVLMNLDPRELSRFPGGPALGLGGVGILSEVVLGVRADHDHLRVVGGVRTIFSNPDDVIAALLPLLERVAQGESVDAEVGALAATQPGTPFAGDVAAGSYGLSMTGAAITTAITAYSLFTDDP